MFFGLLCGPTRREFARWIASPLHQGGDHVRAHHSNESSDDRWQEAVRWAGAFIASFRSPDTRKAYQRDLSCWLTFCAAHHLHPYDGIRRTHVEVYLRQLEQQTPTLANTTLRRRISTLSSWFAWLEDEDINVGNPATRVRRPRRHVRPQPWLDRNELTDLLAAVEDEGGYGYALVCLLGLNGLRVSEACHPNIDDLGGSRYQPTLRILGKGDKPAEIPLNPRTHQALDQALDGRSVGPLLLNRWGNRMQRHNAAAIITRLARRVGITRRVTPHALRRSYITIGLLQVSLCARCNAPLGTPRPTRPSDTTNPNGRSTATRPSCS